MIYLINIQQFLPNEKRNPYDFEWINDFAVARNFSFSKATKLKKTAAKARCDKNYELYDTYCSNSLSYKSAAELWGLPDELS